MEVIYKILTAVTIFVGLCAIGLGIWLWIDEGFPMNNLIPDRNTFGNNPVHLSYFGFVISVMSAFHGVMQYDWFQSSNQHKN